MAPATSLSIPSLIVGASGPGLQIRIPNNSPTPNPPLHVPVLITKDTETVESQITTIKENTSIQELSAPVVFKLLLSEDELRYTHLEVVKPETVVEMFPKWRSAFLESHTEGEYTVFRSKRNQEVLLDGRAVKDRLAELSILGGAARLLARRAKGPELKEVLEINVSKDVRVYVPSLQRRVGSFVWTAQDSIREAVVFIHPELEAVLLPYPRMGLPIGVKDYAVPLAVQQSALNAFIFDENRDGQFAVIGLSTAEISGIPISEIREIAGQSKLLDRLLIEETVGGAIIIKGWAAAAQGAQPTPNYDVLVLLYLALYRIYGDRLSYVQMNPSALTPKIVKTSLWTTTPILTALLEGGFLNPNAVRQAEAVQIGDYSINRYPLTQSGIASLIKIFGPTLIQSEFIVRPFNRAEITFSDVTTGELVFDIFEQNPNMFNILQRSLTTIVFEATGPEPYLNIMKVYFIVRYFKGTVLVSEFNPQKPTIGTDAFEEISRNTEFGGGKAPVQITIIERVPGKPEPFLIGDARAVEAIISPLPESVRRDIVLQEISPNVLGRKIGSKAYVYLVFMLS